MVRVPHHISVAYVAQACKVWLAMIMQCTCVLFYPYAVLPDVSCTQGVLRVLICDQVLKEMCPECDVSQVPHSGPSPVLLRPHELALVAPDWESYTAWIEANKKARDALGERPTCACCSCSMIAGQDCSRTA